MIASDPSSTIPNLLIPFFSSRDILTLGLCHPCDPTSISNLLILVAFLLRIQCLLEDLAAILSKMVEWIDVRVVEEDSRRCYWFLERIDRRYTAANTAGWWGERCNTLCSRCRELAEILIGTVADPQRPLEHSQHNVSSPKVSRIVLPSMSSWWFVWTLPHIKLLLATINGVMWDIATPQLCKWFDFARWRIVVRTGFFIETSGLNAELFCAGTETGCLVVTKMTLKTDVFCEEAAFGSRKIREWTDVYCSYGPIEVQSENSLALVNTVFCLRSIVPLRRILNRIRRISIRSEVCSMKTQDGSIIWRIIIQQTKEFCTTHCHTQ